MESMDNLDDYSASATTVLFHPPIPLLRQPLPADDPELGPYVLAFTSPDSWSAAYTRCQTLIRAQCEQGARISCAVTASNACKPPWWTALTGGSSGDFKERETCEVREFDGCFAAAKDKCSGFAKDKCSRPFLDARIVMARGHEAVSASEVQAFVWLASMPEDSRLRDLIGMDQLGSWVQGSHKTAVTNYRARDMLNSEGQCLVDK